MPNIPPRQRVLDSLEFRSPDVIPLMINPSPAGCYEHGRKLVDLMQACGHDFGPADAFAMPAAPKPEHFDADGRYYRVRTDAWGTQWEHRIFGIWGHRIGYPLADWSALETWTPPAVEPLAGEALDKARSAVAAHKQRYFHTAAVGGFVSLFEQLQSLRPFEDVLMDLALDEPKLHRVADRIVKHWQGVIANVLAADTDAVTFGDDYGTQAGPMISPETWNKFFKPRYDVLMDPIRRAGKKILFHSCGRVEWMLEGLAELGVTSVWPQLPLYDTRELAQRCRDLRLAVRLHPDRGDLMQRGTPEDIRRYVLELVEAFGWQQGGCWLYIEIDPGFPYANAQALFETAMELRQPKKG